MYIRKGRKQVDIRELLDICIDKNLIDITISSRKSKDDSRVQKVKIRPVIIKDSIEFLDDNEAVGNFWEEVENLKMFEKKKEA